MPEAAACVSVGELRDAEGLFGPRELRAMRMCEGLVDMKANNKLYVTDCNYYCTVCIVVTMHCSNYVL
jgi:hypothetical protein